MSVDSKVPVFTEADIRREGYGLNGRPWSTGSSKLVGVPFCPDLLRYEDIGAADNLRGRVVRGFFWLLRWWRP